MTSLKTFASSLLLQLRLRLPLFLRCRSLSVNTDRQSRIISSTSSLAVDMFIKGTAAAMLKEQKKGLLPLKVLELPIGYLVVMSREEAQWERQVLELTWTSERSLIAIVTA